MFNRGKLFGGLELDFEYHGENVDLVDRNSYTFSSISIGDPRPERMVVVAGVLGNSAIVPGQGATVTIGGVAAAVIGDSGAFAAPFIAYRKVATGTTTNIVVTRTTSATPQDCIIGVYTFNTINTTPLDSNISVNTDVACADGGVVLYCAMAQSGGLSATWNGVDAAVNDRTTAVTGGSYNARCFGHVLTTEDSSVRDLSYSQSPFRSVNISFSLD